MIRASFVYTRDGLVTYRVQKGTSKRHVRRFQNSTVFQVALYSLSGAASGQVTENTLTLTPLRTFDFTEGELFFTLVDK